MFLITALIDYIREIWFILLALAVSFGWIKFSDYKEKCRARKRRALQFEIDWELDQQAKLEFRSANA